MCIIAQTQIVFWKKKCNFHCNPKLMKYLPQCLPKYLSLKDFQKNFQYFVLTLPMYCFRRLLYDLPHENYMLNQKSVSTIKTIFTSYSFKKAFRKLLLCWTRRHKFSSSNVRQNNGIKFYCRNYFVFLFCNILYFGAERRAFAFKCINLILTGNWKWRVI